MKLAAESHARIEAFLREHLQEPGLRLPPVTVTCGLPARWLTGAFKVGAITFGRRVFISPRLVVEGPDGRRTAPGWLITHEAVHVLQYEREGWLRFFLTYLLDYWRLLRASGGWDAAARMAAYLAIAKESAAREAASAYQAWNESAGESS